MKDPAYTNALTTALKEQKDLVRRMEPLRRLMEGMKERARKALPKGATEAQVMEELDFHPEKYAGWRELKSRAAELEQDLRKKQKSARETVRARIERETAEKKAAK